MCSGSLNQHLVFGVMHKVNDSMLGKPAAMVKDLNFLL